MSQKPSDIMARLNAGKAVQEEKKTTTAKKAEAVVATKDFAITEAEIKSNPAYAIITDEKLTDQKKLEALHELKTYKAELTKEQNQANREASNQVLLYIENQLMASSQKGIEFTNDNAFALYDETVQELFGNIKVFKGYIEPFVKALEVLQKARDANIPANELIDAVSKMQEDIATQKADKEAKDGELSQLEAGLARFNGEATQTATKLEDLAAKIETATTAKTEAEKSWNVFQRGKAIEAATNDISRYEQQVSVLSETAKVASNNLDRQNTQITALKATIETLSADIATAEEEFASNEDFPAIATLIEITGKDFKDKREEVVTAAQTITEKAIKGIENSIGRFESGVDETGLQLNTITNLNGMVGLLTTADKKVRVTDANFISLQRETIDRITKECEANGENPLYNPDYEIAKNHLDAANQHVSDVISSSERASDLEGKLIRQSGTFRSLGDAYKQKAQDATKLRTSAAVEIPSQLAVTVKSVEMATATESNNMVNEAFTDLGRTTRKSVTSIMDTVMAGAGQNNEKLREAVRSTLETIELFDNVEADLKAKAKEAFEVRQDLDRTQKALRDVTGAVASAVVDAEHAEMKKPAAPKPATPSNG